MGPPLKICGFRSSTTVCPMQIFRAAMISLCPTPTSWVLLDFTTTGHMSPRGQQDLLPGSLTKGVAFVYTCGRAIYQSARSFLLPTQGADTFEFRDLHVKLLPKLAFFALWDAPVLGTPAIISEYLPDDEEEEEDNSDGEDPGGPLPGTGEMPTTSPTVPFVEMLPSTNPALILNPDPEAPLIAIALENFLGAAAVILRQHYQEAVLTLVKQGVAEADLEDAMNPALVELHVQLAAYVAAVVVSLFDADVLATLPASLTPFQQLADEHFVRRALLRQTSYLGEVRAHVQDSEYNVAWGLFHLRWHNREVPRGFGLRLRSVTLYLPQPVAAAVKYPHLSNPPTLVPA